MEQQNEETDNVLRQMATYNFNKPIKVTIIVDEDTDDLNILSVKDRTDNFVENISPVEHTDQRNNLELLTKFTSSDTYLHTTDKIFNSERQTNKANLQNNNVPPAYKEIYHNPDMSRPISTPQTNTSFLNRSRENSCTNNSHYQHFKSSTTNNSNVNKTLIFKVLQEVSYCLIKLSKCYAYNFLNKPHTNDAAYQKALKYYRNFKQECFYYSFSTVKNIMLPLETHPTFIETFINMTIALATKKSWYNITKDFLFNVIKEMLDYTKKKNLYESNMRNSNQNKDKDLICLMSCGPKNREIKISVDPNILYINKKVAGEKPQDTPVTKRPKTNKSCNYQINKTIEACRNSSGSSSQTQMSTHFPNASFEFQKTSYHNNLPFYEQGVINISDDVNDNNHCLTPSRSSVSRDSGVNSPVPTSILNPEDQMAKVDDMLIQFGYSHTMSMNNCECHVTPYICRLCGQSSNMICIGCQRVYYCSLHCQEKDWSIHKFICRM